MALLAQKVKDVLMSPPDWKTIIRCRQQNRIEFAHLSKERLEENSNFVEGSVFSDECSMSWKDFKQAEWQELGYATSRYCLRTIMEYSIAHILVHHT